VKPTAARINSPPEKRSPGGNRGSVETVQRASGNRSTEQPERVAERILADVEADA
jgi:hypothetical protein